MNDPIVALYNLRKHIDASDGTPSFKKPSDARFAIIEVDEILGTVSAYPWSNLKAGVYLCHMENRDPLPVEILWGKGDFEGQKMYRWNQETIPGRLLDTMPKQALLRPAPPGIEIP